MLRLLRQRTARVSSLWGENIPCAVPNRDSEPNNGSIGTTTLKSVSPVKKGESGISKWLALSVFSYLPAESAAASTSASKVIATSAAVVTPSVGPLATTVLSVAPPLAAQALFFSGYQTCKKIKKEGTTGGLPALPFVSIYTNCIVWGLYGSLLGDLTIMAPNLTGTCLGLYYTSVYHAHAADRASLNKHLAASGAIIGTSVAAALLAPTDVAAQVTGLTGCAMSIAMMSSPLMVLKTVLEQRCTSSLPFATSLAGWVNGLSWLLYGSLVAHNPMIYVPNGLGFAAACVQMGLFARFGITTTPPTTTKKMVVVDDCQLEFRPVEAMLVDNLVLTCTVAGTRTYTIVVSGRGARPALEFSDKEMDFGPCFFPSNPGVTPVPETRILRITNNEVDEDVSFDCLFDKKPHLDVDCPARVLTPGETAEVPVRFMPRAMGQYQELVLFEVNGLYTVSLMVRGEGSVASVGLANPAQQTINFGSLRVGQESVRRVRIVNRSKRSATFDLEDPVKDVTTGVGALASAYVSFHPSSASLRPRESVVVEVRFSPPQRVPVFSEPLMINVAGDSTQLLKVQGACQGMDVKLESDTMTFGAVCVGSRLTKVMSLHNTGDIGTKYEWSVDDFAPDFSITPARGFLPAHSEVRFEATFHPTRVSQDVRVDGLRCAIDGAEPLFLSLTGECVAQPESDIQTVTFECAVREEVTKTIALPKNDTSSPWVLTPVIQNEFWRAVNPTVTVPPGATGSCELAYRPLSMTLSEKVNADGSGNGGGGSGGGAGAGAGGAGDDDSGTNPYRRPDVHDGTLFFALPNGRALLFRLRGAATAPGIAATVAETTPAKQSLSFTLPVQNWLKRTQRFKVSWPETEPSTSLRGAKSLDVPAMGERKYKMLFYAYKECKTSTTVTLTNASTGEYMQFAVELTATAAGRVDVIPLEAVVRQTVRHVLTLDNPLGDETIAFSPADVSHPAVRVTQLGDMTGKPEGSFRIDYRPLVPTTEVEETDVTLHSDQLGDFNYTLKLKATRAGAEHALRFRGDLGASQTQTLRFRHFNAAATTYTVTPPRNACFQVPTTVQAPASSSWDGDEVSVEVAFEPDALGSVRDQLVLSSDAGGSYVFPLYGTCVAPKPRGPFTIADGGSVSVDFKNVLRDSAEFALATDNPAFSVASPTVNIPGKGSTTLSVKYAKPSSGAGDIVSGKLIVSCPSVPSLPSWTFYLQGANK